MYPLAVLLEATARATAIPLFGSNYRKALQVGLEQTRRRGVDRKVQPRTDLGWWGQQALLKESRLRAGDLPQRGQLPCG